VTALLQLSQAQAALGQYGQATQSLESARRLAEATADRPQLARVLSALGNAYVVTGAPEAAETHLEQGLTMARALDDAGLAAATLNNLGNLFAGQARYADAVAAYRESAALSRQARNPVATARALSNQASAVHKSGQPREAKALLDEAGIELRQAGASHEKAFALVKVGLGYQDLRPALVDIRDPLLLEAARALNEAGTAAEGLGDRRTASYAWGHLGALYEGERRHE
jgi:tetratricopeptide (TPR) repeat protein